MEQIKPPHKYIILSYGCQGNISDSEQMAAKLLQAGYEQVYQLENADLIILNTCCVRESAEQKIYGKIGELKKLKQLNPDLIIGITGCLAQKDKENLFRKAPHIDFVTGTFVVHQILAHIQQVLETRERVLAVQELTDDFNHVIPVAADGQVSAWVPIMYGCNNFCTYCIVPYVRGRERSRAQNDIIRDIQVLVQKGVKEVTLLGQNVNSYGKDRQDDIDFADLLNSTDEIEGIERIRYMTSHPRDMNAEVIEAIRSGKKLCEHFHLPIQSGSDTILKEMNRGYTTDYYRRLIDEVRQKLPHASVTTDIIVGFPGETAGLFEETLDFINEMRFDAAYTFVYSPRSGTPAAQMPNQVPLAERKERLQQLMNLQNQISLAINETFTGKNLEVLVEGPSKNDAAYWTGRTRTNKIVIWKKGDQEEPGQLLNVKIDKAQTWLLKGQLCI
ncbi:tRNA (N6-isopentenyl adenosine(37)-C2)-methylthiotransferase MiaB [Acetonema longum]|uniref:tRNA-2-methylthio-N(6)-dimethylallyladenosine synthase n=1 Tax=Acetonema longum DSM 6540 TaxID=1009370 RepID=F7NPD4_9FIRM|nr:tRNA (N6-isopentenyl adenosine(37)-C2)-methylthiotransferase MiaB [Acetonema longum]EGO62096.1 RNA modification enzyme, MiaB family protein [Acetonema longum DSM 6540]